MFQTIRAFLAELSASQGALILLYLIADTVTAFKLTIEVDKKFAPTSTTAQFVRSIIQGILTLGLAIVWFLKWW